jgi:hypothetical protein
VQGREGLQRAATATAGRGRVIPMYLPTGRPHVLDVTRTCTDCDVASIAAKCWCCGQRLGDESIQGPVSILNPTGPRPSAVGTGLDL